MLRAAAEMSRGRDALTWLPSRAATSAWFDRIDRFRVGEVEFECSFQDGSTADCFFIHKHRPLVEQYLAVLDGIRNANVVELGIAEGGSVALAALAAPPRKLVALELDENRVDALDELIGRLGLVERVRAYYGVDQADRARLGAIVNDEFGDEPLDLVIDDASHRLDETRASFETLFPRLRPGGLFLIEDWNQQRFGRLLHEALADADSPIRAEATAAAAGRGTAGGGAAPEVDPFNIRLIIELLLAQADSDEFLSEMTVGHYFVGIRRGNGRLDPVAFRLSDLFTDHLGLLPAPQH